MSTWSIVYTEEAEKDLEALDFSVKLQVLKAVRKVAANPLPYTEGGYGKPLGNRITGKLAGYMKIKLLKSGLRVVYGLIRENKIMRIVVISVRDDAAVYKTALKRVNEDPQGRQ